MHYWKRLHSSIDNQDNRSPEISLTLINLVDMNGQQEEFHIDVGCYSPPTTNDAAIMSADGVQTTGGHPSLEPMWVQPKIQQTKIAVTKI